MSRGLRRSAWAEQLRCPQPEGDTTFEHQGQPQKSVMMGPVKMTENSGMLFRNARAGYILGG